jgi:hypothetical protein
MLVNNGYALGDDKEISASTPDIALHVGALDELSWHRTTYLYAAEREGVVEGIQQPSDDLSTALPFHRR